MYFEYAAGVLVRNAQALELMEKVDTLVVDKTGTLTLGKPKLIAVVAAEAFQEADVLRLAAAIERASEHPLAAAIVDGARQRGLDVPAASDFASRTGKGVTGIVEGRKVALGNLALLEEMGVDAAALAPRADEMRADGEWNTLYNRWLRESLGPASAPPIPVYGRT